MWRIIMIKDTITEMTYWTMVQCIDILKEELEHYYRNGKGNPPSASKVLRRYGFKNKRKDKLIKEVEGYLSNVDVVRGI